jgi:hypothetical protein
MRTMKRRIGSTASRSSDWCSHTHSASSSSSLLLLLLPPVLQI